MAAIPQEILNQIPPVWQAQVQAYVNQGALSPEQIPAYIAQANQSGFLPDPSRQAQLAQQTTQQPVTGIPAIARDLAAIRDTYKTQGPGAEKLATAAMAEYARTNGLSPEILAQAAQLIAPNANLWTPDRVQSAINANPPPPINNLPPFQTNPAPPPPTFNAPPSPPQNPNAGRPAALTKEQILQYTGGRDDGRSIYDASKKYGFTATDVDNAFGLAPGTAQQWITTNIQPEAAPTVTGQLPDAPAKGPNTAAFSPQNFVDVAADQGKSNLYAAQQTANLSNPNIQSPFGTQSVTYGPDGQPTVSQTFSPEVQGLYENARKAISPDISKYDFPDIQKLDTGALPQVGLFNLEGLSGVHQFNQANLPNVNKLTTEGLSGVRGLDTSTLAPRTVQGSVGGMESIADALRQREGSRFAQMRSGAEADLLARGFNPGTSGYNARIDDINRQQNDFNLGALLQAGQEQSRLFNLESQGRSQGLTEGTAQQSADMALRGQQFGEKQSLYDAGNQDWQRALTSGLAQQEADMGLRGQQVGERQSLYTNQVDNRQRALGEQLATIGDQTAARQRSIQEQIMARQLPTQEAAQLFSAFGMGPSQQPYTGAQVNASPLFDAFDAAGVYDLSKYATQVGGELGTRQIDMASRAANKSAFGDLLGGIFSIFGK